MSLVKQAAKGVFCMKNNEYAQELLRIAYRDFHNLKGMANITDIDDYAFGFFAQQSVEKGLKAWLSFLGVVYPKNHNLNGLFQLIEEQQIKIPERFFQFLHLTNFAVGFRYEIDPLQGDCLDRIETVADVDDFLDYVQAILGN
jgi:HEPN domain-containing protein